MNDTEIQRLESTSISGELDGSELERQKHSELRGRITTFRNEINQTEAVCWAAAKCWRGRRWLMIAGVPVTALFFGVPGMMWAITILCILIYQKTLAKAI